MTRPAGSPDHRSTLLEFAGLKLTLSAWARRTGISRTTIIERLASGWSIEKTLTTPGRKYQRKAEKE